MDQSPSRPSSLRPPVFRDGLGERRRMADAAGVEKLEILCFRRDLAGAGGFEASLRECVSRLAAFRNAGFARVRTVERLTDAASTLVLASDPTPGDRLSHLLATADRHSLRMNAGAAWSLIKQLVAAVGGLHEHHASAAHGAIGPERVVITPDGRVVVAEHVLGDAIFGLGFPLERLWKELRVASLPGPAAMPLDQRTDITQVGLVALAAILGRPLGDGEYPARVMELEESAWAMTAVTDQRSTPAALRTWLARALQLDARQSFASAVEASAALDKALVESGYVLDRESLASFVALCRQPEQRVAPASSHAAASMAPPTPPQPVAVAAPSAPPVPAAADPALEAAATDSTPAAEMPAILAPAPAPGAAPVQPPAIAATPEPSKPVPAVTAAKPAHKAKPPSAKPKPVQVAAPKPEPVAAPPLAASGEKSPADAAGKVSLLLSPPAQHGKRLAMAAAAVVVLAAGGWFAVNQFTEVRAEPADVVVEAAPPPAPAVNETPAEPVPLAESEPIAPLGPPRGQIDVRTVPPGAVVTIAGQRRGVTPLTVADLAPGRHTVLLEASGVSTTRNVTVEPGQTASLVTELAPPPPAATVGYVAVNAPHPVDIIENGRLLGSSQSGRLSLPAGPHQLELVNSALGYRITRTVQVNPNANTPVNLDFPKGTMALNAIPWAEVFVDGEKVGDTPIGNLQVSLGTHEVVFRNPDLGEQRMTATVTLTAPTRLSVDLRKR